jgi:hypothetical protein
VESALKRFVLGVVIAVIACFGAALTVSQAAAQESALTSHGLLAQLQSFMHERDVDTENLSADEAVKLMIDWYRFTPAAGAPSSIDALVFRYGGWSEGCATAFNLSLLRRIKREGEADAVAGITLMFEPSGQAEIKPFETASSGKSIDDFLVTVEGTAAFKLLGDTKPMSVLMESGGLR